jgi:hypothetical protein
MVVRWRAGSSVIERDVVKDGLGVDVEAPFLLLPFSTGTDLLPLTELPNGLWTEVKFTFPLVVPVPVPSVNAILLLFASRPAIPFKAPIDVDVDTEPGPAFSASPSF